MKKRLVVTVALAAVLILVLLVAMVANAQEPYSSEESGEIGEFGLSDPPPAGMSVLYMFTSAASFDPITRTIATSVHCTNFGSTAVQAQVQMFRADGGATSQTSTTINPNQTWTVSTRNTAIYREDTNLGTPILEQGSGRILADNPTLICTAQLLDPLNNPPKFMSKLPLFDSFGNPINASRRVYLPLILK